MENRTTDLLNIRTGIKTVIIDDNMSLDEYFQNETIRPAVKFQHELLIYSFKSYVKKHKNVFLNLSTDKKLNYIDTILQKDIKYKNSLIGIIIGVFTIEEYKKYIENSSGLNKRVMNIITERLKNNLVRFESKL